MASKKNSSIEKLGLGLSGGGFRASFFHIGVLAQMAEQGLLRHVEVISTVSGGSIVGALYYLHIKKLLESTPDSEIKDSDYVNLVKTIETDFLKATEKNIRMATFTSFKANFKMVELHYSRSDRIAELYNDCLYKGILEGVSEPVQMQELKIFPKDDPNGTAFHPLEHNKTRAAKVPILVLNATALNTGRNWQFTAQTMGEPPTPKTDKMDTKPLRLRRADGYANTIATPINQQTFPLAHAVAASACVPVLFEPMSVSNLYYNRADDENIQVQLVDGGVVDNQGIDGLLQYDCSAFVISDAAGQMGVENSPSVDAVPVALRVNKILQSRVRSQGLLHLVDSHNKADVAFLNLRAGLGIQQVGWFDKDNNQVADTPIAATTKAFGVDPQVQESLSKMRTDLDAFTEVEAYSLMMDAYLMSESELQRFKKETLHSGVKKSAALAPESWNFLAIKKWLNEPSEDYLKQLKVGQATFGKALMLNGWLWVPLLLFVFLVLFLFSAPLAKLLSGGISFSWLIFAAALWLLNKYAPPLMKLVPFLKLLRPKAVYAKAMAKVALLTVATVFMQAYMLIVNPIVLARGRLGKLK